MMSESRTELELPQTMHIEAPAVQPAGEDEGRIPSAREAMLLRIAEKREAALATELGYGEDMHDAARETAGREPVEREVVEPVHEDVPAVMVERREEPAVSSPPSAQQAPAPARHDIEVNGQRFLVTDDELRHLASVGAQFNQYIAQQRQALPQPQFQPQAPVAAAAEEWKPDPERTRAFVKRMQYGSEDEANQAAIEYEQALVERLRAQQPQVNPQQIIDAARQATQQEIVAARQAQELERNLQIIGQEYPDVYGPNEPVSPELQMVYATRAETAAFTLGRLRQQYQMRGVVKSDLDLYRETSDIIRRSIGGVASQPTNREPQAALQAAPIAAVDPSRIERKRAAPRALMAADRRSSSGESAPQYMSNAEYIDQMRQRRGQTSLRG